jgi:hypothetical protein
MKLDLVTKVLTAGAIALSTIPVSLEISQAQSTRSIPSNRGTGRSLSGVWVMGSIDPNPKIRQQLGKHGVYVSQHGDRVMVRPQIGIPRVGEVSGQQVRVIIAENKHILGNISSDGNRVLLTSPGENQATGIMVRVGSSGCPNRGNLFNTIQSCNLER